MGLCSLPNFQILLPAPSFSPVLRTVSALLHSAGLRRPNGDISNFSRLQLFPRCSSPHASRNLRALGHVDCAHCHGADWPLQSRHVVPQLADAVVGSRGEFFLGRAGVFHRSFRPRRRDHLESRWALGLRLVRSTHHPRGP